MKQQPNKRKENTPKVEMKRIKLPINWIGMLQDMHAHTSVNGIKKKKNGRPLTPRSTTFLIWYRHNIIRVHVTLSESKAKCFTRNRKKVRKYFSFEWPLHDLRMTLPINWGYSVLVKALKQGVVPISRKP